MGRPYQPSYRSCARAASYSEKKEVSGVLAEVEQRISALSKIIGNTPLLDIYFAYLGQQRVIYAKSEQVNMTGSIKDRMALHILKEAYATGRIRPGDTIAEATSSNTGIAFCRHR
jgi:cysteine synthase A